MKVFSWNISYLKANDIKFKYLFSLAKEDEFIIILQEVTQKAYQELNLFLADYHIEYSLNYRPMGKFDTKSRGLGIAVIASRKIQVISANILERTLLPERTLLVKCNYENQEFSVLGLHSITGCDHKKAKSLQFYSFAEAVDTFQPDIVCIDANEPEVDNLNVDEMIFFDNKDKGKGAKTFFQTMKNLCLTDAYSILNCNNNIIPFSHVIMGKYKKRYDFIFVNTNAFRILNMTYDYDNAILNGSDHALLIAELESIKYTTI